MIAWRKIRRDIETTAPRYLVCVSGGVDSIFLLDFMTRCDVYLEVVHFDHGMRDDSHNDLKLIREYAREHRFVLWTGRAETLDATSDEAMARKYRWEFIEKIARDRVFTHIVTAHHRDDNIENILIRLMRGDPHHALSMQRCREVNGFVRYKPLLSVEKNEIVSRVRHMGLPYNHDISNDSDKYDRNFVRNTLLPLMATRTNIYQAIQTGIEKTSVLKHCGDAPVS